HTRWLRNSGLYFFALATDQKLYERIKLIALEVGEAGHAALSLADDSGNLLRGSSVANTCKRRKGWRRTFQVVTMAKDALSRIDSAPTCTIVAPLRQTSCPRNVIRVHI